MQGGQGWQMKNVKRPKCLNIGEVCGYKFWEWSDKIWYLRIKLKVKREMVSARVKGWLEKCENWWMDCCKVYILICEKRVWVEVMDKACIKVKVGWKGDECKVDRDY